MFRKVPFILGLLILVSCGGKAYPIPTGVQTATGVLKTTELSLTRRGTHVLEIKGGIPIYVESSKIPLGEFVGREVQLRGTYEANRDKTQPPVLVAETVTPLSSTNARKLTLPGFGMELSVPESWSLATEGERVKFSEGSSVILTVSRESMNILPPLSALPSGEGQEVTVILVGTKSAMRVFDSKGGSEKVYIDPGTGEIPGEKKPGIISLFFTPGQDSSEESRAPFVQLLNSIRFGGNAASASSFSNQSGRSARSSEGSQSSGADAGQPCGGPAGVLCPAGMFCAMTDVEGGYGRCKKRGVR